MKRYKIQDFSRSFNELKLLRGDVLLVHNSLLNFGIPEDIQIQNLSAAIFEELKLKIGDEGTITVPTFNFDFCNGITFNKQMTPSKNMGVFSEFIRKLPDAKRSYHPTQSLTAFGLKADFITEKDTLSSFEYDGAFDRLKQLNGKILLLGADFNSVSMIHWVEERLKVPYRYWKTFDGYYHNDNQTLKKSYKMFVRSLNIDAKLKLYSIEDELKKNNKILESKVGSGMIKIFSINDFIYIAEKFIKKNPYFFVSNHSYFEKT